MTMVVSRKQRIFFRYEGERGAFLVLHHGLLGSHDDWYASGYVEELAKEFRVVVPDARGHGRSDKPAEKEQYSLPQMAEDVIEIMNELGIRNSHFVGYGIGALVGFELLRRFPERVRIAILGGETALVTPAVHDVYRAEAESLNAMSLREYLQALRDQGRVVRSVETVDEEGERPAILALLTAISEWDLAPAERVQVTSPLTLFAGADDPAAQRVESARSGVSRARHVPFPGLSHAGLFQERTHLMDEILRLLKSGRREDSSEVRQRGEGAQPSSEGNRSPGQGGERRQGNQGRREGNRPGNRWNDRPPSGAPAGSGASPNQSGEVPSPIPGAVLDGRSVVAAPDQTWPDEPGPAEGIEATGEFAAGAESPEALRGDPDRTESDPYEPPSEAIPDEMGNGVEEQETLPAEAGEAATNLVLAEEAAWQSEAVPAPGPEPEGPASVQPDSESKKD